MGYEPRDWRVEPPAHGHVHADHLRCGEGGDGYAERGISRYVQSIYIWHVYATAVYSVKWSVLYFAGWSTLLGLKLIFPIHRIQMRDLQRCAVPDRETSSRLHGGHWPRHGLDVHVVCPRLRRVLKLHIHTLTHIWEREKSIFERGAKKASAGANHGINELGNTSGIVPLDRGQFILVWYRCACIGLFAICECHPLLGKEEQRSIKPNRIGYPQPRGSGFWSQDLERSTWN